MRLTIVLILLIFVLVSILPIALIWSLNTLFPSLMIESTFTNYLAAWVLLSILKLSTTNIE